MTRRLLFLPILAIAAGAFALLTALGPEPSAREGELLPAAVRVETVRLAPRRATVSAHGVVRPAAARSWLPRWPDGSPGPPRVCGTAPA